MPLVERPLVKRRISAGLALVLALVMLAAVVTLEASRGAFIDITDAVGSSFTTAATGCSEPPTTTYDFAGITSPSSTHTAEDGEIDEPDAVIEAGTFSARRDTITGWANWAEATTAEYTNLDGSDNNYYQGADPGAKDNAAMIFEFDVAEDPGCVTQIDVSVEAAMGGNPPAADFLFVYLWNYATSSYLVGGSMNGTTDTVVSFSVTTDPGDYIQTSDGQLTVFVVNEDVSDWIRIDDITVTVIADPANLEQLHYRWRIDDGAETGAGPAPLQASATVDTAAETSATDVLVPGMTLTPGAGDYLVSFSGSMENSNPTGTEADYVSLYVNGVQMAHTERGVSADGSLPDTAIPVGFQALVTGVGAGETIEVRWRTTSGSIIMHERTLVAETITLADVSQATATTDTTTTSDTDVALAGMTLTPGAGDYLIWFSGSVENDAGNSTQNASLYVNGSQVAHSERVAVIEFSFIDTPLPVMFHALVTGVGAGEAIDVRWRTTGGGTATMHERTLVVQEITAADVSQASATADTPGETSTTDVLVPGMTLTPGAGDYLVWFSGSFDDLLPGDDEIMNVSLYVNGAQVAHTERQAKNELSLDDIATTFPVMFQAFVTGVGAADAIEVRWRTDTGTMTMHERTLVVAEVSSAGGATWAADEDTALSGLTKGTTRRLRILISNAGGASGGVAYRLQVSNPNPVSCDNAGTTWTRIDASTHWDMVTSTHFDDGDPTSNIVPGLSDPGGGKTFFSGELQESPTDETSAIALSGTQFTEIEYAVEATPSASDGAVYCFRLTDAGDPADFTYTETTYGKVTLAPGTGSWYDTDWAYRSKITIDNTKVSGSANLAYFPVLVNTTDANWADTANGGNVEQADGGDILFTASDGTTKLDHEIEKYINTSGELVAWVELPDVSYNTDTDFYIYYGNSTGVADQWDISGTWDEGGSSNFKGVWHLKEDPSAAAPQFLNSATASNDGTANSLSTSNQVPGQIDGSLLFDDTNERHVNVPHTASLQLATNMTVSAWVQTSDTETDTALIVNKWNTTTGANYWLGKLDASDLAFYVDASQNVTTALTDINDGTWHRVVGVADVANSLLKIYVDCTEKNTAAYDGTSETGTSDLHIGKATDASTQEWDGKIDETRVSDVARTAGWICTEFNNQSDPGNFYQVLAEEAVSWYNNDWSFRKKITIDPAKVDANLTQFPVLINLATDAELALNAQNDGDDILFTSSDGTTKIPHEIELFDGGDGELVAWVKVPAVSASVDTDIYMYYGEGTVGSQQDVVNVWDINYELVQHLQETSGQHLDSTDNNHDSTTVSVTAQGSAIGQMNGADEFAGDPDSVDIPDHVDLDIATGITVEAWVRIDDTNGEQGIVSHEDHSANEGYYLYFQDGMNFKVFDGATVYAAQSFNVTITAGTLYHVVAIYDGSTVQVYVDTTLGTTEPSFSGSIQASSEPLGFGRCNGGCYIDGVIDEIRISNIARSNAWTSAGYKNQSDPGTFYQVFAEEAV